MEANLFSLAARVCVSLVIASFGSWVGVLAMLPVICFLCKFWHHVMAAGSVDGALLVFRLGIVAWLQKAQMVVSIGKYFVAVLQSSSSLPSGLSEAIVLMKI